MFCFWSSLFTGGRDGTAWHSSPVREAPDLGIVWSHSSLILIRNESQLAIGFRVRFWGSELGSAYMCMLYICMWRGWFYGWAFSWVVSLVWAVNGGAVGACVMLYTACHMNGCVHLWLGETVVHSAVGLRWMSHHTNTSGKCCRQCWC